MEIQKVFSDYYDTERMYSVLMSEDELRLFSKIQDLDYIADQKARKEEVKHAKLVNALVVGLPSAALGSTLGIISNPSNPGKGILIGAGVGAGLGSALGYHIGKEHKKEIESDAEREIERYIRANDSDRAYLRKRYEKAKEREIREQQLAAMQSASTALWLK